MTKSTIDAMRVLATGNNTVNRRRPPRLIRVDGVLCAFSLFDAEGAAMLRLIAHPTIRISRYIMHGYLEDSKKRQFIGARAGTMGGRAARWD